MSSGIKKHVLLSSTKLKFEMQLCAEHGVKNKNYYNIK